MARARRYGPEAGKATASTLEVAGNVGEAAWNVKQMGSKVLIGKTAATIGKRDTTAAILDV